MSPKSTQFRHLSPLFGTVVNYFVHKTFRLTDGRVLPSKKFYISHKDTRWQIKDKCTLARHTARHLYQQTKSSPIKSVQMMCENKERRASSWPCRLSGNIFFEGVSSRFLESTFTYINVLWLYGHWPRNESGSLRHESNKSLPLLFTRTCHWIIPHTHKRHHGRGDTYSVCCISIS